MHKQHIRSATKWALQCLVRGRGEENGEEVDFSLCLVWEKMGNVMDLSINK